MPFEEQKSWGIDKEVQEDSTEDKEGLIQEIESQDGLQQALRRCAQDRLADIPPLLHLRLQLGH